MPWTWARVWALLLRQTARRWQAPPSGRSSTGAPPPRPSAGRWSRPCAIPRIATRSARHAGGYSVYRALAIAAKTLSSDHLTDLTDTAPAEPIGPHPQWFDAKKIVSLDPWGHLVGDAFRDHLARGYDVRPTIAVTRAHIDMPEIRAAIAARPHPRRRRHRVGRRQCARDEGGDRSGLVSARHRRALRPRRERSAPRAARADRRHVSGAGDAARPQGVPAADRRHHHLLLRRSGEVRRRQDAARLPRARRVQRLRRVRLRHLHLPALSRARHRDLPSRWRRPAASASWSTTARKAARSARSPSSWSTTRASGRRAATARRPISSAPSASPACRTCASRS